MGLYEDIGAAWCREGVVQRRLPEWIDFSDGVERCEYPWNEKDGTYDVEPPRKMADYFRAHSYTAWSPEKRLEALLDSTYAARVCSSDIPYTPSAEECPTVLPALGQYISEQEAIWQAAYGARQSPYSVRSSQQIERDLSPGIGAGLMRALPGIGKQYFMQALGWGAAQTAE